MGKNEEECEWYIDNSIDKRCLYCGKCGRFVEEINLWEYIPKKSEITCAYCQDEEDEEN